MNRSNIFTRIALHNNSTSIRLPPPALSKIVHLFQSVAEQPKKSDIINNLQKAFACSTSIAQKIYDQFPSLRSVDAIKNDTLQFLRSKVSSESIVENPLVVTMDADSVKNKIQKLYSLEPDRLDDFFPLLTLDNDELNKLVTRLIKEKDDIEQKNRIYYLSEKLQVEPKIVSKYRADCGSDIFASPLQSFKKKLDILLDYGIQFVTNNNIYGLSVLRYNDGVFVRRFERMISVKLPVKISYFQLPESDFNELIEKHIAENRIKENSSNIRRMKKSNEEEIQIISSLNSLLETNESESIELYYSYVNGIKALEFAQRNIEHLQSIGIEVETIRQNGYLLTMPMDEIEAKIDILKEMKPKNINDFIPLMSVTTTKLNQYKWNVKYNSNNMVGENHIIYYFSEKLNMPANVVAAHFAENGIGFDQIQLESKLDVLLKYNVDRESILNSKKTFRYSAERIEEEICQLKSKGFHKISSWMIFDSKARRTILDRKMREKELLEGFDDNMHYLAHRLNWNPSELEFAQKKYPKLNKSSAFKIREHLDYLLNETDFTTEDITNSLYILNKSLDEIKARVNEITQIGGHKNSKLFTLANIYQGKNRYLKLIKNYCDTSLRGVAGEKAFATIEIRIKQEKLPT